MDRTFNLPLVLLRASDWFNDALMEDLRHLGWPPVSRSQSLVFAYLDPTGTRPAELARRMNTSRQAVHQLLRPLVERGLIELHPDESDGRASRAHPTPRAFEMGVDIASLLDGYEEELVQRIGAANARALARIVRLDWGPPPVCQPDRVHPFTGDARRGRSESARAGRGRHPSKSGPRRSVAG